MLSTSRQVANDIFKSNGVVSDQQGILLVTFPHMLILFLRVGCIRYILCIRGIIKLCGFSFLLFHNCIHLLR
jgi:hypothetical protein